MPCSNGSFFVRLSLLILVACAGVSAQEAAAPLSMEEARKQRATALEQRHGKVSGKEALKQTYEDGKPKRNYDAIKFLSLIHI